MSTETTIPAAGTEEEPKRRVIPTAADYTVPPEKADEAAKIEAELREWGASEDAIHVVLAPSDPSYVSLCCGKRRCAESVASAVYLSLALGLPIEFDNAEPASDPA